MSDIVKKESTDSTALAKKGSPFAAKRVGIAAKIAEAAQNQINPAEMPERIALVFDNSGSMAGKKINDAKIATNEFAKACNPQTTALALYGFGETHRYSLTLDYVSLSLLAQSFSASEGTPLYSTLKALIAKENITRVVVFSDGDPTDHDTVDYNYNNDGWESTRKPSESIAYGPIIKSFVDKKIPVDTVYLGENGDTSMGAKTLKSIAEWTGGVYLWFKDSGTFAKAFKYLTPAFRAMLTDGNFRKGIGAE